MCVQGWAGRGMGPHTRLGPAQPAPPPPWLELPSQGLGFVIPKEPSALISPLGSTAICVLCSQRGPIHPSLSISNTYLSLCPCRLCPGLSSTSSRASLPPWPSHFGCQTHPPLTLSLSPLWTFSSSPVPTEFKHFSLGFRVPSLWSPCLRILSLAPCHRPFTPALRLLTALFFSASRLLFMLFLYLEDLSPGPIFLRQILFFFRGQD